MHCRLISLIIAVVIAFVASGCGGGSGGTSADPLETDSLTLTSSDTQVDLNDTVTLTAKVTNASGAGVVGREVFFRFDSNTSGATLSSTRVNTGSTGEASVIYTAGTTAGYDVVRASISNGSNMVANIRVAGTTTYGISVTASPADISEMEGQSVVEAEVLEYDSGATTGIPVSGVTVNFSVIAGGSALGSVSPAAAVTDGSGNAITIYQGGDVTAGGTYSDVVRASFTIGGITYSDAVQIGYAP